MSPHLSGCFSFLNGLSCLDSDDNEIEEVLEYDDIKAGVKPTSSEARQWWSNLSPEMRRKIAKEEHVKNEADKKFKIYLKALIMQAEELG